MKEQATNALYKSINKIVCGITCYNILFDVQLMSKMLQNKEADLNSVTRATASDQELLQV